MFVEEHLRELRHARYRPVAFVRYALRLSKQVREDVDAAPSAVRSVWTVALGFFVATFLAAVGLALGHDRSLAYDFFLATALTILGSFGFVTLYIGMLRDRDGYRLSSLNVPIALTLARVALLPGIVLFLLDGHYRLAFGTFLVAALSDVADGWVARRFGQVTVLGTVLDPLVDIVFNLALFGGLSFSGLLPMWVFGVALVRYGILLVGGAGLYLFVGPLRIQPTLSGRLTGVVLSTLVALLVLLDVARGRIHDALATLTQTALGVLLVGTVLQALSLGWYNLRVMRGQATARGRVVGDVRWGAQ